MEEKPYGFIYITTNKINGVKYIGQKSYQTKDWKNYLGSGIYLKRAIKKYGSKNFERKIIENCFSKKELDEREIYWIDYYNAVNSNQFYNIAKGGDGGNAMAGFSEDRKNEYKNLLSSLRKNKINQGKDNPMAKQVICLNNMKIFDTTIEAAKYASTKDYLIQECCRNPERSKTAGKHPLTKEKLQWGYYEEGNQYTFIPFERKYKTKKVYCFENNKIYNSAKEASLELNISLTSIRDSCKGRIKSVKGKHFIYICQNENGEIISEKTKLIEINP